MLDEQNRGAVLAVELAKDFDHLVALRRPQARHHLVEQQQLGLGRQRPRHFQSLAVGQGQAFRELVAAIVKTEPRQDRRCAVARLREVGFAMEGTHGDVLQHAQPLERLHELEGASDAGVAGAIGPQAGDHLAVQADGAGVGREDAGDHVEDRGLARAVGSDQGVDGASRNAETHVVHGAQAAEALADIGELESCAAHFGRSAKPSFPASHGHTPAGRYITITSSARP